MENGYQNEIDFINYLNSKKYADVNIMMQDFIKALFPDIKQQDTIKAYKYGHYAKTDIVIDINGIKKGISIKCGSRNSVHIEPISKFVNYLQKLDFDEINKLLEYIYSDGTNNNTDTLRQSAEEYKIKHSQDILLINNSLKSIKKDLIIRFLIKTDINYKITVDAFMEGQPFDFIWATKNEIINYLVKQEPISSGVHVSNLFIQNWNKNIKQNPKYEYCRDYIQVKWYSMFDDLIRIMCERENK